MILTPRMWEIKQRMEALELWVLADPGDYLLQFELDELRIEFKRLSQMEKLGLRVIQGGQSSNPSTPLKVQTS